MKNLSIIKKTTVITYKMLGESSAVIPRNEKTTITLFGIPIYKSHTHLA